jgi:diketogulonate reductase-like aldo/keto reductase
MHRHRNLDVQPVIYASFPVSAAKQTRTKLFWVIMQRVVVIPNRRFRTTCRSNLKCLFFILENEIIGCTETSVRNYHYSLRNSPEERSYQPVN